MITALIAAQPKAATTHMTFALARYTGSQFGWVNLYANNGIETQDPNPQLLQSAMRSAEKIIVKPHMQATPNNVNLLAQAGIRPIVMTRDIMDTVVSMRDHFDRIIDPEDSEHIPGDFIPMPLGLPLYQKTYRPLSPLARVDYIISFVVPWILMFQHGWSKVQGDIFRIDYDDFIASKAQVFEEALKFLGEKDVDGERVQEAIRPNDLRFNKVVTGRGKEELTVQNKIRIDEMRWGLNGEAPLS